MLDRHELHAKAFVNFYAILLTPSSRTPDDAAMESLLERNHSGPLFV